MDKMVNKFLPARVVSYEDLCSDVRLFSIQPVGETSHFDVGSHIQIQCGGADVRDVRSYSLIGRARDEPYYRIAVRRVPTSRGGSRFMWDLPLGAEVRISTPHNNFPLSNTKGKKLLVAGGIGITPLFGMALNLMEEDANFHIAYAGRSADTMPFLSELTELLGSRLSVFEASRERFVDFSALIDELPTDGEMYVCGPQPMLDAADRAWSGAGRDRTKLRFEAFGNSGSLPTKPFFVRVPRLGLAFDVPANSTLLAELEANGADPLFNCRKGECGLCAVTVDGLVGHIDHRDVFFSARQKSENVALCACVSRISGHGEISIDLP